MRCYESTNLLFRGVRVDSQEGAEGDSQNFILFIFESPSPYYDAMLIEWIDQGLVKSLSAVAEVL